MQPSTEVEIRDTVNFRRFAVEMHTNGRQWTSKRCEQWKHSGLSKR